MRSLGSPVRVPQRLWRLAAVGAGARRVAATRRPGGHAAQAAAGQPPINAGWLRRLPAKSADELTFADFKNAIDAEYGTAPPPAEDVTPFVAARESRPEALAQRKAAEERNLFARWEWFVAPRVYPTGRFDNEKVLNELRRVKEVDAALVAGLATTASRRPRGSRGARSTPSAAPTWAA